MVIWQAIVRLLDRNKLSRKYWPLTALFISCSPEVTDQPIIFISFAFRWAPLASDLLLQTRAAHLAHTARDTYRASEGRPAFVLGRRVCWPRDRSTAGADLSWPSLRHLNENEFQRIRDTLTLSYKSTYGGTLHKLPKRCVMVPLRRCLTCILLVPVHGYVFYSTWGSG